MSHQIDNISISGYKSIAQCDVKMHKLNILIGANGAGKSNFLSIFRLLNNLAHKNLAIFVKKQGGASQLLHFGAKYTAEAKVHLVFGSKTYTCRFMRDNLDNLLIKSEEIGCYGEGYEKPLVRQLAKATDNTGLLTVGDDSAHEVVSALQGWRVYHFHDTSEQAKIKNWQHSNDTLYLQADAANLAPFLLKLSQHYPQHYQRIVQTIRLIAPFFRDFFMPTDDDNSIRLRWWHRDSEDYFDVSQLSDGTLRMICLITLLLQPNPPATIIIDEPELGLHPYAITILSSLLKQAAQSSQIIVSTQSVNLLDTFEPEDIITVDYRAGKSILQRLEPQHLKQWLQDYSLGQIWQRNIIGARPRA